MITIAAAIAAEEAHIAKLAANPGWRDYIRDKARKMAAWQPAMYGHLPQIVAATPINQPETANALPA